jgi:hypothetical protein
MVCGQSDDATNLIGAALIRSVLLWHIGRQARSTQGDHLWSDLTSKNSSNPYSPRSRPTPDCL